MPAIRLDKGNETAQFIHGDDQRDALEELRYWLDEQPPDVLDGITIDAGVGRVYRLTVNPLTVWIGDRGFRLDEFGQAREWFVARAARQGGHWL